MTFKVDDKVIWLGTCEGDRQEIFLGTVTKIGGTKSMPTVYVNYKHKPEDQMYSAFVWPDCEEARAHLNKTLEVAARHKQENLDLLSEALQLSNEFTRQGRK